MKPDEASPNWFIDAAEGIANKVDAKVIDQMKKTAEAMRKEQERIDAMKRMGVAAEEAAAALADFSKSIPRGGLVSGSPSRYRAGASARYRAGASGGASSGSIFAGFIIDEQKDQPRPRPVTPEAGLKAILDAVRNAGSPDDVMRVGGEWMTKVTLEISRIVREAAPPDE